MTDKSIGQIAYEAAARLTKCNQPWSEANQLKWEDAAKAVHAIAIKSPEAAEYWKKWADLPTISDYPDAIEALKEAQSDER